jgi:hypothetical protein
MGGKRVFLSLQVLHATHPQRVFGTGVQGISGFGRFIIDQRPADGVIMDGMEGLLRDLNKRLNA